MHYQINARYFEVPTGGGFTVTKAFNEQHEAYFSPNDMRVIESICYFNNNCVQDNNQRGIPSVIHLLRILHSMDTEHIVAELQSIMFNINDYIEEFRENKVEILAVLIGILADSLL